MKQNKILLMNHKCSNREKHTNRRLESQHGKQNFPNIDNVNVITDLGYSIYSDS